MSQSLSYVPLHIVFSTKGRQPWLTKEIRAGLFPFISGVAVRVGFSLDTAGGAADHVHLLGNLGRTHPIADVVKEVKRVSNQWCKEAGLTDFAWQSGYGAFGVGVGQEAAVRRYIEDQERHHRLRSFQEEYRELLAEHGIPFDEKYVWD